MDIIYSLIIAFILAVFAWLFCYVNLKIQMAFNPLFEWCKGIEASLSTTFAAIVFVISFVTIFVQAITH